MAVVLRGSWAAVAIVAFAGCSVLNSPARPDLTLLQDAGDATCNLRVPSARPIGPDGDDGNEYLFAGLDVVLNQDMDRWRDIGFDLDGLCSSAADPRTECEAAGGLEEDGNSGIDNVFGHTFFTVVNFAVPGLEDMARMTQRAGRGHLVMRVRNWNGLDDDPRVDVAIIPAAFTLPADAMGNLPTYTVTNFAPFIGGMAATMPSWDGSDYTLLRRQAFLSGDVNQPLVRDDNAYIVGRVVVARLPDRAEIVFPTATAGISAVLTGGIIVGQISADNSTIERMAVAGRWGVNDLLLTAENIGVCQGSTNYGFLMNALRTNADIRSQPGTGGPGVSCDALSIGVLFTGIRVQFGGLETGRQLIDLCANMGDGGVPDAGTADAGVDGG